MPGLGRHCLETKKTKEEMKEEGSHGGSSEHPEGETEPVAAADAGCRARWYSLTAAVHAPADSACKDGILESAPAAVVTNCTENSEEACWEKSPSWWEKVLNSEGIEQRDKEGEMSTGEEDMGSEVDC